MMILEKGYVAIAHTEQQVVDVRNNEVLSSYEGRFLTNDLLVVIGKPRYCSLTQFVLYLTQGT